jgi:hypothetical protein
MGKSMRLLESNIFRIGMIALAFFLGIVFTAFLVLVPVHVVGR